LEFVHRYSDPWDQEAVALLAAVLAYGNVKQIRRSVQNALNQIQSEASSPSEFVRSLQTAQGLEKADRTFRGFIHRFNTGKDLAMLFRLLARSWGTHGSLGAHFMQYLEPNDSHIGPALDAFVSEWRSWEKQEWGTRKKSQSFSYLLTAPQDGSCCKRWCMFLRWVGRRDELDPGLWAQGSALSQTFPSGRYLRTDQLIIPLDTHTGRISQYLGLTHRKSLNWLAAVEVTQALQSCDLKDPTRYDFAISRLGILDLCQKEYRVEICKSCELLSVCSFAKKRGSLGASR